MKNHLTELASAWVVAIALIVAMAAHAFLPRTPPHLVGVTTPSQVRPDLGYKPGERDVPLLEFGVAPGAGGDHNVGTIPRLPQRPRSDRPAG